MCLCGRPRLQSMACAHRRYFPPKTVAHQVYLGVSNQMGVIGCGPTKLFNKTSLLELHKKQTSILILRSWSIGLAQTMVLRIYYYTNCPNLNCTRQKNCQCTPEIVGAHRHWTFFPCTPEISSKVPYFADCFSASSI